MAESTQGAVAERPENCWEVSRCGREEGGACAASLGVCPAARETRLDGINRGHNGGRACWALHGVQVGEPNGQQGLDRFMECLLCPFLGRVEREEGAAFSFLADAGRALGPSSGVLR